MEHVSSTVAAGPVTLNSVPPPQNVHLQFGQLTIVPEARRVVRDGKPILLRRKEYQLLEFLARNKNTVVNRHTLLEYVWNYNVQSVTNTLDVHISNLRRKIADESSQLIQTIYGAGYMLCDE